MAAVIYAGKAIIPAPFASLSKDVQTTEDGTPIGTQFNITLKGKLVAHKGSPDSDGTFWTVSGYPPDETLTHDQMMASLIRKVEALRSLFATEGQTLEIAPWDGSAPMKCNPTGFQLNIAEGKWFTDIEYTISCKCDILYVNGLATGEDSGDIVNYKVSRASEDWSIDQADDKGRTYKLTHNLSATGKRFFDEAGSLTKPAWERAQDYVHGKLGLGLVNARMVASGVIDGDSLRAYNYVRSQNLNELAGTYAVQESWLCYNPGSGAAAVEEITFNST